jgi:hypothetical protein
MLCVIDWRDRLHNFKNQTACSDLQALNRKSGCHGQPFSTGFWWTTIPMLSQIYRKPLQVRVRQVDIRQFAALALYPSSKAPQSSSVQWSKGSFVLSLFSDLSSRAKF